MRRMIALVIGAGLMLASVPSVAGADGTETLGPPSIVVASGTGVAVGGVGLFTQPASFTVTVPDDAVVKQVLLYYEAGHHPGDVSGDTPDHDVQINGVVVSAQLIGGPTFFYGDVQTATHRADVTALGFIHPGTNTVVVNGLDADEVDDGAGVFVIYEQPGRSVQLGLVDGNDIAFVGFESPRDATVPQTFTFEPAAVDRVASLTLLTGSVHDPAPTPNPSGDQKNRPNFVEVTSGGRVTRLADPLGDQAPEWDAGSIDVIVPAGATSLTARYLSEFDETGDLPASLVWLGAALAVPLAQPPVTSTTPPATVPPTTTPPTTTAPTTQTTPPAAVSGEQRSIPTTGTDPTSLLWAAAALGAAGAVTLLAIRRRSSP